MRSATHFSLPVRGLSSFGFPRDAESKMTCVILLKQDTIPEQEAKTWSGVCVYLSYGSTSSELSNNKPTI